MAVFGEFPTHCFPFLLAPKRLSLLSGLVQKGQATFSCTHIGLWLDPTSAVSLVYQLVFSAPTYYIEIKKIDWIEKQK